MGGMGGANHRISGIDGGSAMNIVMPVYTIGILIFFVYTMMKVWNIIIYTWLLFHICVEIIAGLHNYLLNLISQ